MLLWEFRGKSLKVIFIAEDFIIIAIVIEHRALVPLNYRNGPGALDTGIVPFLHIRKPRVTMLSHPRPLSKKSQNSNPVRELTLELSFEGQVGLSSESLAFQAEGIALGMRSETMEYF